LTGRATVRLIGLPSRVGSPQARGRSISKGGQRRELKPFTCGSGETTSVVLRPAAHGVGPRGSQSPMQKATAGCQIT